MKNSYYIHGEKLFIELVKKNGERFETAVDSSLEKRLNEIDIRWNAVVWPHSDKIYVQGTYYFQEKIYKTIVLHRWIVDCPKGLFVDHINHNTLDNTFTNLRITNRSENGYNRKAAQVDSKIKVLNVHKATNGKKFIAQIVFNGKKEYLGRHSTIEEAKKSVDEFKKRYLYKELTKDDIDEAKEYIKQSKVGKSTGSSGHRGIHFHKRTGKWAVVKNRKHIGLYDTLEQAISCRGKT